MLKRSRLVTFAVLLSLFLAGCITSQMLGDKIYKERISTYLVSEDEKHLILISDRHHYILELSELIKSVLKASYRSQIDLRIPRVDVAADGSTKVAYTFILGKTITDQDKEAAIQAGFKPDKYMGLIATGELLGTRYEKPLLPENTPTKKFHSPYEILIVEKQQRGEKIVKTALSPVTAAADGFLLLLGVPLFAANVLINGHE